MVSSAGYVVIFDTISALLAGIVIIPAVFAQGAGTGFRSGASFYHHAGRDPQHSLRQVFAIVFFAAVLFAGMASPAESAGKSGGGSPVPVRLVRKASLALVGAVTAGVGLFVEGDLLSPWMDSISIYVIPLGALLAGITMFWIGGKKFARDAVQLGRKRRLGRWFEPMTRYVFCGVALGVYILGNFLWRNRLIREILQTANPPGQWEDHCTATWQTAHHRSLHRKPHKMPHAP